MHPLPTAALELHRRLAQLAQIRLGLHLQFVDADEARRAGQRHLFGAVLTRCQIRHLDGLLFVVVLELLEARERNERQDAVLVGRRFVVAELQNFDAGGRFLPLFVDLRCGGGHPGHAARADEELPGLQFDFLAVVVNDGKGGAGSLGGFLGRQQRILAGEARDQAATQQQGQQVGSHRKFSARRQRQTNSTGVVWIHREGFPSHKGRGSDKLRESKARRAGRRIEDRDMSANWDRCYRRHFGSYFGKPFDVQTYRPGADSPPLQLATFDQPYPGYRVYASVGLTAYEADVKALGEVMLQALFISEAEHELLKRQGPTVLEERLHGQEADLCSLLRPSSV